MNKKTEKHPVLKTIRMIVILLLSAVCLFCAVRLAVYYIEFKINEQLVASIADMAKIERDHTPDRNDEPTDSDVSEESARYSDKLTFTIDFPKLNKSYSDMQAWLYSEGTPIDYPVAQAKDNETYLSVSPDGSYNPNGTLFIDCRNKSDFTDNKTIIYGHHMRSGSMFGTLPNYKSQDYYDEHPVMYLITKKGEYAVLLFAGAVVPEDSEIYSVGIDDEELFKLVEELREDSTFTSSVALKKGERILTLSTCSYEYDGARFILLGKLVKI
ncbi:MAG: class B sortase [Ruminococcus sp.]|nr:class B sortase [Ruminococcus sp.]